MEDKNTPSNKSKILVNFCAYEAHEPLPDLYINLGTITPKKLEQLLKAFETAKPAEDACIKTMNLSYQDLVSFGNIPGPVERYCVLDLTGMFYMFDETRKLPPCLDTTKNKKISTDRQMINKCAKHLREGKCQDPFIRSTLGAILYPHIYKKKSK